MLRHVAKEIVTVTVTQLNRLQSIFTTLFLRMDQQCVFVNKEIFSSNLLERILYETASFVNNVYLIYYTYEC